MGSQLRRGRRGRFCWLRQLVARVKFLRCLGRWRIRWHRGRAGQGLQTWRRERSMPIFSTGSSLWRIPAVSLKRRRYGPASAVSSTMSRVVPWMLLTIARSSPSNALSSDDLPTFVLPIIATGIPSFMAFPAAKLSERFCRARADSSARARSLSREANSTSSSLKSSSSSRSDASSTRRARMLLMC